MSAELVHFGDGWLTKSAQDLCKIAIVFGGFDAGEIVLAVTKLQRKRSAKANTATVEKALQMVFDSHQTSEELEARAKTHAAFIARLRGQAD